MVYSKSLELKESKYETSWLEDTIRSIALSVVGHGSSGTSRAGGIPCAPIVSASELRACGDAAAAGWLQRVRWRSKGY